MTRHHDERILSVMLDRVAAGEPLDEVMRDYGWTRAPSPTVDVDYAECTSCAVKPRASDPCVACVWNRNAIASLRAALSAAHAAIRERDERLSELMGRHG